jgi:hypothetical protein
MFPPPPVDKGRNPLARARGEHTSRAQPRRVLARTRALAHPPHCRRCRTTLPSRRNTPTCTTTAREGPSRGCAATRGAHDLKKSDSLICCNPDNHATGTSTCPALGEKNIRISPVALTGGRHMSQSVRRELDSVSTYRNQFHRILNYYG